jgi:eukaryotic-like serine/threonine-protein kinase
MLDERDQVHLMDFGLAARQDEESRLTSDETVMDTPRYMAPEQARGQKGEARPAADQYSAGIVLYELLCGEVPFGGPAPAVIHSQTHTPPEPPSVRRPGLPKDLETVCLKAIAKRPEDRYADCGAFADDLRRWLDGEPIAARRLGPLAQLARWARANKAVAALAATVVSSWFAAAAGRSERSALTALDVAEESRGRAVAAQHAAEQSRAELRNTLYCANTQLLQSAWGLGHVDRVQRLLAGNVPVPATGDEDLRGVEWYYWDNVLSRCTVALGSYRETWTLAAAFGPDGRTLFSGHNTGSIRQWTLKSVGGKTVGERREFDAHRGPVRGLAYTGGRCWLASAGEDGVDKVWDGATRAEPRVLVKSGRAWRTLAVSPDERWLAACDWAVTVWRTEDWSSWHTFTSEGKGQVAPEFVAGLAFAPNGDRLYAACGTQHVVGWSLEGRAEAVLFRTEVLADVRSVAVSPDGRLLATGDLLGRVGCPDRPAQRPAGRPPGPGVRGRLGPRRPLRGELRRRPAGPRLGPVGERSPHLPRARSPDRGHGRQQGWRARRHGRLRRAGVPLDRAGAAGLLDR